MIHSFLLIGQSNMAGRGYLEEAEPIDMSHIKILRNGRWQSMFRPINPDRSFSGVNLAESFAEAYANEHGVDVGLICCADGGTALSQWEEGSLLFENAVYQTKLAKRTSVVQGILWHQGEADCAPELYKTYEARFTAFMHALCGALDLWDVPFLIGGLGEFLKDCTYDEKLKNYDRLNQVFQNLAKTHPNVGFVPADGLGANPDNLHFDAKALYAFGRRYYDVFAKMRGSGAKIFDAPAEADTTRTAMELL